MNDLPLLTSSERFHQLLEDSLDCSTANPMMEETTATSDNPLWLVEADLSDEAWLKRA